MVDNILLVQEAIHSSQARGKLGMATKIYMSNAFDMVRHNFLLVVLTSFSFKEEVISWITTYIHNPLISPLVNETPTSFFKISRGIRKECPLSNILYIMMVESLSIRMDQ